MEIAEAMFERAEVRAGASTRADDGALTMAQTIARVGLSCALVVFVSAIFASQVYFTLR